MNLLHWILFTNRVDLLKCMINQLFSICDAAET